MSIRALRKDLDQRWLLEAGATIGWLAGVDEASGQLTVDFSGNNEGPLAAQSLVVFDAETARQYVAERTPVLLVVDACEPRRAFVLGCLLPRAVLPSAAEQTSDKDREGADFSAGQTGKLAVDAHLDGQRVILEGKQQVILRCGEASIELRHDGKIVIRGLHVVTHADGVNRIRGGAVQIN